MKATRWLRLALAAAVVAAAVYFLGAVIARNWETVRSYSWTIRPGWMLASVAAHVAVLAFGVYVWHRIARCFDGQPARYGVMLRVWAISTAARYIPGSIWQFVAAAQTAHAAGMSRLLMATSLAVHLGLVLAAAAIVAAVGLPADSLGGGVAPAVRWAALPLALVAVHPAVLNLGLRLLARVSRRDALVWRGSWSMGMGLLALEVVSWLLYGVAFLMFLRGLTDVPIKRYAEVTGVNALSFAAGLFSPSPGGLGVRETAMTALLRPLFPIGVAGAVSAFARLWSIAAELGVALLAVLLARANRPR